MRARLWCLTLVCTALMLAPPRVYADQQPGHERVDYTAYTLRRNEFSVGVGSAAYGVLDQVELGTYVLPWFAFPLLEAPIATGYLKVRDWFAGPVAFSLRGTFAYLNATALSSKLWKNASTSAGLLVIPIEFSASVRASQSFSQSLQLTWVHVGLGGDMPSGSDVDIGLGGASTATSASLSSLSEVRVSRVVALTLRGTLLLGISDIVVNADYERNGTHVDARLGAIYHQPAIVGNIIPGIALSWSHVNLHLGLGIGSNWLPIVNLPTRPVTLVPDADFYLRF